MVQQVPSRIEDLEGMPEPSRDDDGKLLAYDWQTDSYILKPEPKPAPRRGPLAFATGNLGPTKLRKLDDTSGTPGPATDGYAYLYDSDSDTFVLSEVTGGGTSTIAGATDFNDTTGPATDGYVIAWDDGASEFGLVAQPTVITDHGDLDGLGDDDHTQYHNDTRGDLRYKRLVEVGADGNHFLEGTTGTPTGWTELSAANESTQDETPSFWYTRLTSATANFDYYYQSSGSLSGTWESYVFGGARVRDGGYTGDLDVYYGIHADDGAGAPDDDVFLRIQLNWDSASEQWRVRGQSKNGTTQNDGAWFALDEFFPEDLYFRVTKRPAANTLKCYFGYSPSVDQQKLIYQSAFSTALWNGDAVFRYECDHAGGVQAYIRLDYIDETDDP